MLRYTHIYELLYRIGKIIISFMSVASIFGLFGITVFTKSGGVSSLAIYAMFGGCAIGVSYLIDMVIGWLPTFLYIRYTLSTKISPSEAGSLSFLFNGSLNGKWYPLLNIKGLKPEARKEALFQFAKTITITLAGKKAGGS